MAQDWLNADGLYLQYGTDKVTPGTAGDYQMPGPNRITEILVDMTKLTTSAVIQDNRLIFPAGSNNYIEAVELIAEVGCTSGTSFSLGLIQMDRSTIPSGYSAAFVSALDAAGAGVLDVAGSRLYLTDDSTGAGSLIGSYPAAATGPYYITALHATTAYDAGVVRCRIFWHGVGTINDAAYASQY